MTIPFNSILDDYCGSHINHQFYNETAPMLLTERNMGSFSTQILTEYCIIIMICWSFQAVFAFYFRTIARYLKDKCKAPQAENTSSDIKTIILLPIFIIALCFVICGIFVMVHFFNDMAQYYDFVNKTVNFPSSNVTQSLIDQDYESVAQCIESGLGSIACPVLFERYMDPENDATDPRNQPYTLQEAEALCWWTYNMLIIANPRIFQYSVLATFIGFDAIIYIFIVFIVSFCPCCFCRFIASCTCLCGCCAESRKCATVARYCCDVNFCKGPCCCYCLCGCFGIFLWLFELVYIIILVIILIWIFCVLLAFSIFVPVVVMLFIIISILTLPAFCCHCCCFVKSDETKNSTETGIVLRVKETLRLDEKPQNEIVSASVNFKIARFFSAILSCCMIILFLFVVEPFISGSMIYYVVDGPIFGAWNYYGPFLGGVIDFIVLFYQTMTDAEKMQLYLGFIGESVSWSSFSFNSDLNAFRYCVFMLRIVLEITIAIMEIIIEDIKL